MTSTSETGHAKNYANFDTLISYCLGYGTAYAPSNLNLRMAALNMKNVEAFNALQLVTTTKTALDNAIHAREIGFSNLRTLTTRVLNALAASGATEQTVQSAKGIKRKIDGKRATTIKPVPATTPTTDPMSTPKQISVSQQSYDQLYDHFLQLIQVLVAYTHYVPNEADLKTAALTTLSKKLSTLNHGVRLARTEYDNARIARNKSFYAPDAGMLAMARDVKSYIKSVFGASSPEFKEISGIQFRNQKA